VTVITGSVLQRIVQSNADLSILAGRLAYSKEKTSTQQETFLENNRQQLENAILSISPRGAFYYQRFTIGNYGQHRKPGITLFFSNAITGEQVFTIFNVCRKRARSTKAGKAGELLKGNRFIITKNYELYKLWMSTGLKTPPLSDFSRHMGNLKPIILTGEFNHLDQPNKLQSSSIRAMNITNSELTILVNKSSITGQQDVNKPSIIPINKEVAKNLRIAELQPKSTTCIKNCENKLISKAMTSSPYPSIVDRTNKKHPSRQTNEEWLSDYG